MPFDPNTALVIWRAYSSRGIKSGLEEAYSGTLIGAQRGPAQGVSLRAAQHVFVHIEIKQQRRIRIDIHSSETDVC